MCCPSQCLVGASPEDPGNAELPITGSTHRDRPTVYGVSYFPSKGPTLDGRTKPDLVAPGEYIKCARDQRRFHFLARITYDRRIQQGSVVGDRTLDLE